MTKREKWLTVAIVVVVLILAVVGVRYYYVKRHLSTARLVGINPPGAYYPGSPWTYTFDNGTRVTQPTEASATVNTTYSIDLVPDGIANDTTTIEPTP